MRLHGVVAPPPTPLDHEGDTLDLAAVGRIVEYLLAGGVHGVFVNGTTGEGALLTVDERERTTAAAFVEAAAGRLAVIVQVGDASTSVSARLARHAATVGADAVAVVAPYYFEHDQAALERHVRAVAEATAVPTFLYDIPQRTANGYGLEITRRLYADGVVVGSKDSSGNLPKMLGLLDLDGFVLLTGADHLAMTTLQAGAAGLVTGPGCVFLEPYVRLFDSLAAGDLAGSRAARLQATGALRSSTTPSRACRECRCERTVQLASAAGLGGRRLLFAFLLRIGGFPLAQVALGMVLGPILEVNFMVSAIKSRWDLTAFFDRSIAIGLMIGTLVVVVIGIRIKARATSAVRAAQREQSQD